MPRPSSSGMLSEPQRFASASHVPGSFRDMGHLPQTIATDIPTMRRQASTSPKEEVNLATCVHMLLNPMIGDVFCITSIAGCRSSNIAISVLVIRSFTHFGQPQFTRMTRYATADRDVLIRVM